MTEDETRAIVRTVIRTEAKVQRLETLVWVILILIAGTALRQFLG